MIKLFLSIAIFPFFVVADLDSANKKDKDQNQDNKKSQLVLNKKAKLELENKIKTQIAQMADEEKIAQLFAIRVYAKKPIEEILEVFFPGAFMYDKPFTSKTDYKTWFKKMDALQKMSVEKTSWLSLCMANEEGGDITRMKKDFFKLKNTKHSYFDMPSPLKLAGSNNLKQVEEFAYELGLLLQILGINMNLAPVVDVFSPHQDGYIRGRSFSSDPHEVQKLSQAFTKGLQKAGVIATFKHFPGYTNTKLNSHNDFVTIDFSKKELLKRDWLPYKFKEGLSYPRAVMSNIALYPQLDKSSTAPLSKKIITGILKKELAYKGLVVTDDIGMKGYKEKDLTKRAIQSFLAGNDMILISAVPNDKLIQIYKGMLQAFKKGAIPKERVHKSLSKILKLRASLSYDKQSFSKRMKLLGESKEKLYHINKKLTQSVVDEFFKKNPDLKHSLAQDMSMISFSKDSYQVIKNLGYFKKHEKNLLKKKAQVRKNYNLSSKRIGFCYKDIVKFCHQHFTEKEKKHIIMIDTRNKPLASHLRKQYKVYIPAYGFIPGVGEMFLQNMIKKANSQAKLSL